MTQDNQLYLPPRMMLRLCVAVLFASTWARSVEELTCDGDELSASTYLLQMESGRVISSTSTLQENGSTHFWPSARGHAGRYGTSEVTAIRDISAGPTWSWQDDKGRWSDIPTGVTIDDKKYIYLTLATGAKKFSPSGQVVWEYKRASPKEQISDGSSIWDGALYGLTSAARVFAVDIETGKELWSKKVGTSKTLNFGQVAAHDGVVIVASQNDIAGTALRHPMLSLTFGSPDDTITGMNTTDGSVLWTFKPENPVWNFAASFVGDGSFVFQDVTGKAHRAFVNNGTSIWSAGGTDKSWTDGHASVGPNGIAYSVANYGPIMDHGVLTAYRMTDGKVLWSQNTSRPPNGAPVVGKLFGQNSYSVVLPAGQQCKKGEQIMVYTYDAESGKPQWTFFGPRQQGDDVAGDAEGVEQRLANNIRAKTAPNPWGQAVIDKAGTVFVGGETGHFFSLRDADGDGEVNSNDSAEVSVFDAGAAWVGSSGPALADGMLAVAPQDRLHVWQW